MHDHENVDFVSYAQNGEDVVLNRAFDGQRNGFFVDVGAGDPDRDSVTKNLVERLSWRGINIEPVPEVHARLVTRRPWDVNLKVAIGTVPGAATFYRLTDPPDRLHGVDMSTLDPEMAARHASAGWPVERIQVEVLTLDSILESHARPGFDLLKIDVEGRERDVLASTNLPRWRPRVLVVEATEPGTPIPSHAGWEPMVLSAGYRLALFDGLNRFYARDDEGSLFERLAVPANVFDRWIPYRLLRALRSEETTGSDQDRTPRAASRPGSAPATPGPQAGRRPPANADRPSPDLRSLGPHHQAR
jgi:FkbM family methyltransferase